MKGPSLSRRLSGSGQELLLVVAIVAGTAYWFWQGREAANSGAPTASGARQQGPGGGRPGRFGAALAPVQAATATSEAVKNVRDSITSTVSKVTDSFKKAPSHSSDKTSDSGAKQDSKSNDSDN